ncbi:MAG: hypothetical protein IJV94_02750 [Bacilli bacterium]|nr:hypothetical protein [Bacilli bacterium]
MAININLYPPIVDTYVPAFLTDSGTDKDICRIYFTLSQFNTMGDIENVQVTVRSQYTNLSVLNKSKYPSEVMLTSIQEDASKTSDDRYYIELNKTDIQGGQFEINQYYKVQMRFTHIDAADVSLTTPQAIDGWLAANINLFSEWSTVCLIRGISTPQLAVSGFTIEGGEISWANYNPIIYGTLSFNNEEETEKLKSYQVKLYDENDNLLTDSGIQYTNTNSFSYGLNYNFVAGAAYKFTIECTTMNLYSAIATYEFTTATEESEILDFTFIAETDEDNGRIILTIKKSNITDGFTGELVLRRTSNKTNFTIWEDLKTYTYEGATAIKETFSDMTIESGVWYKYYLQKRSNGVAASTKYIKTPVMVIFDDMFLTTKDRQLKIKFNPTVSSFKRTIQESRTDTLGSQFPFVRRNGHANYAQFPIGGLISFQIDESELFTSLEELFGEHLYLYTDYNNDHRITEANNIVYEKLFKDKVIEFLYSEQPKLFRSATEGNFIVKVMDASFSPNATLGRRIVSFTATAYEVAECNIDNFKKYDILEGNDE